ncbi:NADH-quinone oxidoreductase subunit L [Thermosulfuriphilus sp.]
MKYIVLIPALPLLAAIITLVFGRRYIQHRAHWLPTLAVLGSFLLSLKALAQVASGAQVNFDLYSWIVGVSFKGSIGFLVDPLSAMMMAMVCSLSFLIHVYSIGYMANDPGYYRFFAYISLFTFSMLMLVMANNFLQLFFGWEAVGLCSYLLIGFWYRKKSAANAAKKAFIVNRFGDFGFALGIFLIFWVFKSVYYQDVFGAAEVMGAKGLYLWGWEIPLATLIALLLFCGAVGKSAQFPLHVWLPDAMEGPTPVSALIHAATMVTAGVFVVARCHVFFVLSPTALAVVALLGTFTCFMAATIAMTQFDIKRVIAYSTLSQLGYMFMACGVGAFDAGMFHLFTHAYFKALLFLGAGSVIHAMHRASDPNDLRYMGGLRKYMPITYVTFLVASLSISGVPGLAGFFSKDLILFSALASKYPWGQWVWAVGTLVAGMTAFYSFRLVFLAFFGEFRGQRHLKGHLPHESPLVMTLPLVALAVGAIVTGYLWIPHALGGPDIFGHFLAPVLGHHPYLAVSHEEAAKLEYLVTASSVGVGLLGIWLAWLVYVRRPALQRLLPESFPSLYDFLYRKWYWDEIYSCLVVVPTKSLAWFFQRVTDGILIEGVVNGVPGLIQRAGLFVRQVQCGLVHFYALIMTTGVVVVVALIYLLRG